jgi:hypothetical protein
VSKISPRESLAVRITVNGRLTDEAYRVGSARQKAYEEATRVAQEADSARISEAKHRQMAEQEFAMVMKRGLELVEQKAGDEKGTEGEH